MAKTMEYCGPNPQLIGKTALVRDDPVTAALGRRAPLLLAQFDLPCTVVNGVHLGFGWHPFNRSDFKEPSNA